MCEGTPRFDSWWRYAERKRGTPRKTSGMSLPAVCRPSRRRMIPSLASPYSSGQRDVAQNHWRRSYPGSNPGGDIRTGRCTGVTTSHLRWCQYRRDRRLTAVGAFLSNRPPHQQTGSSGRDNSSDTYRRRARAPRSEEETPRCKLAEQSVGQTTPSHGFPQFQ